MLFESDTSAKLPLASIATPNGPLNEARLPMPSKKPVNPLPASVVTTPENRNPFHVGVKLTAASDSNAPDAMATERIRLL